MPSKSPAQAKLMRAVAHGWKPDRMKGPPRKVAKEFVAADKKAKGYQYGGLKRALKKAQDKRSPEERWREKYGTEPLTMSQAGRRSGKKGPVSFLTAVREMGKAGWTQAGEKWYPPQATAVAPGEGGLAAAAGPTRTTQPIEEGRQFISGPSPKAMAAAPQRTAADVAPGFQPGRVPPALVQYLASLQPPAQEEPVQMQHGGMLNFLQKGRVPPMQQAGGQGQPPGGGGGFQQFLRRGQVPGGGGGGGPQQMPQPGGVGLPPGMSIPKFGEGPARGPTRGPEWGGSPDANQNFADVIRNRGVAGPQPRPPGGGVPLRGVGRPPGMGRPGAGGGAGDYQRMLQQRKQQATAPGAGGNVQAAVMPGRGFMPGGGGAGMPGGANRIGMGDQQGALARATQVQTGRPPMSRRQGFPGRGGPGGGFGRRRGRGRGRFQR